jgi:putative transposase
VSMDHERADREVWAAAERRPAVLAKLPEQPMEAEVRAVCATLGVSRATLFRWLKRYHKTGRTSALLPRRRGPPQGMAPLPP